MGNPQSGISDDNSALVSVRLKMTSYPNMVRTEKTGKISPIIYDVVCYLANVFCRLYFRVKKVGIENVPREGGVLLIANHSSYLDPPLVGTTVSRRIYYLAKEELFRIPFFSWIISRIGSIPVKRGGVDRKAIERCRDLLSSGEVLLMFPEGTRSYDGEMGEVRHGAVMIASSVENLPIVPIYIDGSFRSLPRGRWMPLPVKITVKVGKPFKIEQKGVAMDKKSYYESASKLFLDRIQSLK